MPTPLTSPLALVLSPLLAIAAAATPAMAAQPNQRALTVDVQTRNGVTVYCAEEATSGSYIPQKICRTRAQWIEAGATFRSTAQLALNDRAQGNHN